MKFAAVLSLLALLSMPVSPVFAGQATESAEKLDPKDPNYVRCRKIAVIGSLVKKERICKTNAEWARTNEDAQRNAEDLIVRNRTGTNGQ
ncbi:MAG: hypothetical protein ACK5SX_15830 [Sandaracinobacter sp.]